MPTYDGYRRAIEGRSLPLAFCDLDLLDANAEAMAERAGSTPIRVASKSVRCRAVLERVLARPGYRGVMCFSAAEAAHLATHGFDDLLVAYPTMEQSEIRSVCTHVGAGKSITLMVDDAAQVRAAAACARSTGVTLPLCIDVDMSMQLPGLWFGVRRSPIRNPEAALSLARVIAAEEGTRLDGVMGYEAQIAGVPDAIPGKRAMNAAVRMLKHRSIGELQERRQAVVDALRREGFELRLVNGGGTGSIESTARDRSVTELTVGSGLYSPGLFDDYAAFRHRPAAGFALPITRRPAPDIYTCHGGGYVASGAAGKDRLPVPYLPEGAALLPLEGAGEVQTPIRYTGSVTLRIGDPVFLRHAKAGELCERFSTLTLLSKGRVVDEVPTYRGDGQCFL